MFHNNNNVFITLISEFEGAHSSFVELLFFPDEIKLLLLNERERHTQKKNNEQRYQFRIKLMALKTETRKERQSRNLRLSNPTFKFRLNSFFIWNIKAILESTKMNSEMQKISNSSRNGNFSNSNAAWQSKRRNLPNKLLKIEVAINPKAENVFSVDEIADSTLRERGRLKGTEIK